MKGLSRRKENKHNNHEVTRKGFASKLSVDVVDWTAGTIQVNEHTIAMNVVRLLESHGLILEKYSGWSSAESVCILHSHKRSTILIGSLTITCALFK